MLDKKFDEILDRIGQLSEENQTRVLDGLIGIVNSIDKEKENEVEVCANKGHKFVGKYDGWYDKSYYLDESRSTLRLAPSLFLLRTGKLGDNVQLNWSRRCSKCGVVETVNHIPEVVMCKVNVKN